MNDPEHFLSRWSRKKQQDKRQEAQQGAHEETRQEKRDENRQETRQENRAERHEAATPPAPEQTRAPGEGAVAFDPASLPPIESIGAQTDIGAFLRPGVPSDLRHAALRRAWSVDPAIRDFKGLQENDWDFNDPNGIPGFGPLSPDLDVKKMVGALFGETPKQEPTAPARDAAPPDRPADAAAETKPQTGDIGIAGTPRDDAGMIMPPEADAGSAEPKDGALPTVSTQSDFVRRENTCALRDEISESDSTPAKRRRPGGGALPQ